MLPSLSLPGPTSDVIAAPPQNHLVIEAPATDVTSLLTRPRPATLWSLTAHGVLLLGLIGLGGTEASVETPTVAIQVSLALPFNHPPIDGDVRKTPASLPPPPTEITASEPPSATAPEPPAPPEAMEPVPPLSPESIDIPLPDIAPPVDVAALAPVQPPTPAAPKVSTAKPEPAPIPPKPPAKITPAAAKSVARPAQSTPVAPPAPAVSAVPAAPVQQQTEAAESTAPVSAPAEGSSTVTAAPQVAAAPSALALLLPGDPPTGNFLRKPTPPLYPRRALEMQLEGRVLLFIRLDETGAVQEVVVNQSSGHAILDRAAVAAVDSWSFAPSRLNGHPIPSWVKVPVPFRLK
jgi:protein TonB